jgi:cysteine-S-conjugate beta-lyase
MKKDTIITTAGRNPEGNFGIVNPPVYHASTVTFPTVAELEAAQDQVFSVVRYGRFGTPTTQALEAAVAALEGGNRTVSVPSGLAAITVSLMAFLEAGDHLLMADSVYFPTRKLCDGLLARFGVETTYYDPMIGAGIAELITPKTKVVFVESPGSLTFEVQDIPAIAAAAQARGAIVIMDNTWSGGLYFQPFEMGVDVSVHAATKYIVGHSDAMLGTITAIEELAAKIKLTANGLGYCAGPDDCYLALRGLRTISPRMARHQETALTLAHWLAERPEVAHVLHPAFPNCPGHEFWKRDFSGASGLFGVVLNDYPKAAVEAMLDGMELFAMGFSWGGYESLMIPTYPAKIRTVTEWPYSGPSLRLHAGLEDVSDLIADLEKGLARLNAAV